MHLTPKVAVSISLYSCLLCHPHFILLCTVSHGVSSIKFDMLHVYTQLYTCIYTHLNKYNQLIIVIFYLYSDCLIHLCIILYLFCIHILSHIVYQKMFKSYNYLHYEWTRPLLSTAMPHCTIFYFIFSLYSDKLGILISQILPPELLEFHQ